MYNSDYIAFVGRKQEFTQLQEFCQDTEQISWWAIAGPGGMGKSRLIYEFTNAQKADGWEICWLKHSDYSNLSHWTPPVDRCIVVADDVQAHLHTIGNWIITISARQRSEKLRIILLERDGKDMSSAKWAELMQSESPYDDTISSKCYCPDFLNLAPLLDDELKAIMMDFAKASDKSLANSEHADRLLQTLKKIDGNLQRPIYALAITDAWCSGKDPTRWSKEQILDTLVTRELKFYYSRLSSLSSDRISKETRSELENLLAQSCTVPILPLNQIDYDKYPKLQKRADDLDLTFHELLRQIGIAHKMEVHIQIKDDESENLLTRKDIIEAIVLDCPDLIKEYLVLRQTLKKNRLDLLLPQDWDNTPMPLLFINRILIDYPEKLEEINQFWAAFFSGNPRSEFSAQIYGGLLFGTAAQLPKLKKQAMNRLEKLYYYFHDSENIAVLYAKGLVNLSVNQTLEDCSHSVDMLKLLFDQFPTNEELAVLYANGLVNLSVNQTLENRSHSVDILKLLFDQSPTNEKLVVAYANGLVNLSAKQKLENRSHSVDMLKLLFDQSPTNEELAVAYANGLGNLTIPEKTTLEDCSHSVDMLKLLFDQFSTNEELATVYAGCLVNLSLKQTKEVDVQENIQQVEKLFTKYCQNTEIQLSYAQTLFNLTLKQESETLQQTVAQIRKFLLKHSEANQGFQDALDTYLNKHPDHTERYTSLRV